MNFDAIIAALTVTANAALETYRAAHSAFIVAEAAGRHSARTAAARRDLDAAYAAHTAAYAALSAALEVVPVVEVPGGIDLLELCELMGA